VKIRTIAQLKTPGILVFFVLLLSIAPPHAAANGPATPVFINEIHYDNTSTDTGEAVEIAGPSGTDLTSWSLVGYTGSNGTSYNTINLSGTIPNQQAGFGTLSFAFTGLQNGAPDGIALVDDASTVIQFLSYEGDFTATNGPANGMLSTDIGVSQAAPGAVGDSLQLGGTGSTYEDFGWNGNAGETFGSPNNGQTFSGTINPPGPGDVLINEFVANATTEWVELYNTTGSELDLSGHFIDDVDGGGGSPMEIPGGTTIPAGGYYVMTFSGFLNNGGDDVRFLDPTQTTVLDTFTYASATADFSWYRSPDGGPWNPTETDSPTMGSANPGGELSDPVINEFVVNHTGTDTHEFVEIKGDPNTDYSDFWIVEIEGEPTGTGLIDDGTVQIGTTDANGYWTTGFQSNVYENGTLTLMIVEGLTGTVGDDIDTNDNGEIDTTFWTRIVDDVGISDAVSGEFVYSAIELTPTFDGGSETPGGASRIPDGTDTDATDDWVRNDFDGYGLPCCAGTPELGEAENTPDAENLLIETEPIGACFDPATFIHEVQGDGAASPLAGNLVEVEGVVVGDFQSTTTELGGFFLQEENGDADADPATSEGVFVFDNGFGVDVAEGEVVRVKGTVTEFFDLTEINGVTGVVVCDTGATVTPASISLPVDSIDDLEAFEGMAVTIDQELTVTENFSLGRFGEVMLSAGGRLYNPTNVVDPGTPANDLQDLNDRSRIQLDDGSNVQNPLPLPPYLGDGNTLRSGDTLPSLTGVLGYAFGEYEIQPTGVISFTRTNERTVAPEDVGGSLQVASFNVLNYFTTIDTGPNICGPLANQDCRGADSASELIRQTDKIVNALLAIDADVVGLIEIENDAADVAVAGLVTALNAEAGAGTYAYIATGPIGSDAIRVALIYKPGSVTPVGAHAILDASVDPTFLDDKNRPVLAQTFEENASGERFTVAVNHLKSKGSACDDVGDPDTGDGQGNCNLTRLAAAIALANWLATDPTSSGDPDFLTIGDFNSYAMEDPIVALEDAGYTDLVEAFEGADAYSYVFFGQAGYLDSAFANPALTPQVSGTTVWHINADEPVSLDYNEEFNQPGLYTDEPYRSSDHDAVIVGLDLIPETTEFFYYFPFIAHSSDD